MTSGTFISLPLASIIINRAERQRRELPNIDILADSINRLGLIHPIVIDSDHVLVAGERRLEAVRSLGWTHINAQFVNDLDPLVAHAIELEENVKRENLPWQDECKAIADYHALRASQEADWNNDKTAEALGISETVVRHKIDVARELNSGNRMVAEAPKYSTARGIVSRAKERQQNDAIDALAKVIGPAAKLETIERPPAILNADFNEWAPEYTGPKFNFIHCDFPYGINADKFNQGAASLHGGYADSEDVYWKLCATLAAHLDRVASEQCHFMFWFSMHFYQPTLDFFEQNTDIKFDPFPLIWTKSDNIGIIPDPERGPRRIYETCLFGSRGDRKIVRPVSNSLSVPSERSTHMSIKPQAMLSHFFRMFVDSSTIFLDPTCGSGSSVRTANAAGAKFSQGLEINPDFAAEANRRFNAGVNDAGNQSSGVDKDNGRPLEDHGDE